MTDTATATPEQATPETPTTQPIGPESSIGTKGVYETRDKLSVVVHELKLGGLYDIIGALKTADLRAAPPMLSNQQLSKLVAINEDYISGWWETWQDTIVAWLTGAPDLLNAVIRAFADISVEQVAQLGLKDAVAIISLGIEQSDPAGLVEVSRGFFQHIGGLLPADDRPEGVTDITDVLAQAAATTPTASATTTGANGS